MDWVPYTEQEIEDFAHTRLTIVGGHLFAMAPKLRRDFAKAVGALPPWQQILMIENGGDNIVSDFERINEMNPLPDSGFVSGFFWPGEFVLEGDTMIRPFNGENGIFWAYDSGYPLRTLYHEQGHRIDHMIVQFEGDYHGEHYLSDCNAQWLKNVDKEKERFGLHTSRRALGGNRDKVNDDAEIVPLYDHYRRLPDHLARYKNPKTHAREAFAEMNAHYSLLYAQTDGDVHIIDRKLERHLPSLWPVFRDVVIPICENLAHSTLPYKLPNFMARLG